MHLKPAALLISLAALAFLAGASKPANPKADIAKAVARELRDDMPRHTTAEIRAEIKPVDINSDGIQDWQVDFGSFGFGWCGTGGCRYQLWLGRKAGPPLKVFDRQMRELKIERHAGRPVFVFDFHGSECGGTGNIACPGHFVWSARRGRMVLLPTPGKHTSVANPLDMDQ